ncbi:hypothetical protein M3603_12710 [Rummeliibacillus stabekisii]|uniref:hypothetical protein n=1 Tax=Rummeliibacillus stabekisii TaxID=241244 RepID=UPI0020403B3C|nr:hypothetical protein [Rummeliibacillus stabekisii]MCM3317488.1 hypothetical protein [Rummeliibacillus stabekisii]
MLLSAKITKQPISGKYPEQIFVAPFSTAEWTWVKFEDEDYNEFYGQFQGNPNTVALSPKNKFCYVLTDTFLYEIDSQSPSNYQVHDFWETGRTIRNVTFSPEGKPLFSDYYTIFTITKSIDELVQLENPKLLENSIPVDNIEFDNWEGHLLHINAETFLEGQPIKLIFDATTMRISENKENL